MQSRKTVLNLPVLNRAVTVHELTVSDIRAISLSGAKSEEDYAFYLYFYSTDLTAPLLARLSTPEHEAELAALVEIILDLNKAFFEPPENGQSPIAPDPEGAARALEKSVARLIRCGHANAWDYPWRVFLSAAEEAEEKDREAGNGT
jgi:hypothetical protein